jgi:putative addiction module component (TIGR02574 family)
MPTAHEDLLTKALALPVDARVKLVEKLIGSLNVPTQKDIDELWSKEAERRVEQIENGEVELIPGEIVFEKVRKNISR